MYHNLTFARIWPQEPLFLRSDLGSSSIFITGVRHDLEILYHCGKRVKTKSQNFLGVNSFVCRSYREKLAGGLFVPTPILNRVIIDACVVAFCVFFLKKKLLLNLRILLEHVIFQYVTVFWNWEYSKLVLLMRFWSTIVCKFFFEKLKNQTKVDRARQL